MHRSVTALSLLLLAGLPAAAHTGSAPGGFAGGMAHPLFGPDHVAAMVAVGLWGAFLGPPALWLLPVVFPLVMAFGGVVGILGLPLPGVEACIALSAIVLGLMVMLAARPPLWTAAALVGAFAVFHGYAHGAELPPGAVEAGNAHLGDEEDQIGARQKRQRPVRPIGRQVDKNGAEFACGQLDDLQQLLARQRFQRHHARRRGNDVKSARVRCRRGPEQVAVQPRASLDEFGKRQFRRQAQLEGGVAELDVEIDQAGLAALLGLLLRELDRQLRKQRRRSDSVHSRLA